MKNPFLTTLRHLGEGTRLYGRVQHGQSVGIFVVSLYLPLMLPLLSTGAWTELEGWLEQVVVPSAGLLLAAYAVVVAIVIALALTPPGTVNLVPLAPYPVERPVKTRILLNSRLFVIAMLGFGTMGIIFTTGLDRIEHVLCLGIGAVLLQLGHLDEVNAVQVEPVLERIAETPLENYDRWYAARWGRTPRREPAMRHRRIMRRRRTLVALLAAGYLLMLLGYILVVHGAAELGRHAPIVLFLAAMGALTTVRALEAEMLSVMVARHSAGSRFDSRFSHVETYFSLVLIGSKLAATAAMAALPVLWFSPRTAVGSLIYLGLLLLDVLVFFWVLALLSRRWLDVPAHAIKPIGTYDRDYMLFIRRKHAARERAAIRGAMRYAARCTQPDADPS